MNKVFIILWVMMVVVILCLSGCGKPAHMEEYACINSRVHKLERGIWVAEKRADNMVECVVL